MKNYLELRDPLRLSGYRVDLVSCRDYPRLEPFACWDASRQSQSLEWYDAYNKVKHQSAEFASRANIMNAMNACAAAMVMAIAQFGDTPFQREGAFAQRVFTIYALPDFASDEVYRAVRGQEWKTVPYFEKS